MNKKDTLIQDWRNEALQYSHYNAAEGTQWHIEKSKRLQSRDNLIELTVIAITIYGMNIRQIPLKGQPLLLDISGIETMANRQIESLLHEEKTLESISDILEVVKGSNYVPLEVAKEILKCIG